MKLKFEELIKQLQSLGSPKDKIDVLQKQISEETKINNSILTATKNKNNVEEKIQNIIISIKNIDFNALEFEKIKETINKLESAYQKYLQLEVIAKNYTLYSEKEITLTKQLNITVEENKNINDKLLKLKSEYNSDKHNDIKTSLDKLKLESARLEENIKINQAQLTKLKKEFDILIKQKEMIKKEETQLTKLMIINNFVDLSRDIFKSCGPQIGRFYIENIAIEANNLYQEITEQQLQNLSWNLDYDIEVEENGLKRSFTNLSGGEQMAAALSIRLSLLRELSDLNIAFFDEPTTNMDEIRRMNLARQIKNITTFDQMFIISHDDTFEKDIDNVIRLSDNA